MDDLPDVVRDLAAQWSLEVGAPFQPGGVTSWTAPARTRNGEAVVLKVGWRHDEALHEADALRTWAGRGAVRLLASRLEEVTVALLLEAAQPGRALSESALPAEQDHVIAGLLRRLWVVPAPGHPFRTLESMCRSWAAQFEATSGRRTRDGALLDAALVAAGLEALTTLPATAASSVLLCTDLDAGNVLAARREPWLVIDPKPYVGDPTYDPTQHLLNHPGLREDPLALTSRLAGLLQLDVERLRLWTFARCVHAHLDQPHLAPVAATLAP